MFTIILLFGFLGLLLQRVSGTGFALVMVPVYTLFLGPVQGVMVSNILNGVGCLLLMLTVWRDLQWRRILLISGFAVIGMVPGIFIIKLLSPGFLQLSIGLLMLFALAVSLRFNVDQPGKEGLLPIVLCGLGGGFLVTTAGIPAPAMVIYARYINWPFRQFNAAMQGVFFIICLLTTFLKLNSGVPLPGEIFTLPHNVWLFLAALVGMAVGGYLSKIIPVKYASASAFIVSVLGAAIATGRGAWMLFIG